MTKHRFLILLLIFTLALPHAVWAAGTEARSISVFRVDGDDVKMSKGSPKMFAAREGYQLNDGYTLTTGLDSYCYIQMDEDSILKMDQSSKVAVSKKSADKLSVSVQSGGALMDAGPQDGEQVIETRVGNTGLTIRGTKFVIGPDAETGRTKITMLEGEGDVDGRPLSAGSVMLVYDEDTPDFEEHTYEIIDSIPESDPDLFTLTAIQESTDELIDSGVITPEFAESIPEALEQKQLEFNELIMKPAVEDNVVPVDGQPLQPTAAPEIEYTLPTPTPAPTSAPVATSAPARTERPRDRDDDDDDDNSGNSGGDDNPQPSDAPDDGYGTYTHYNFIYVGEFQNGAPNGQGILYEMRPFSTPTESTTSALFIVTRANFVDGYAHGPISEVWYMNDGDIIAWDDYDLEYGYIPEDDLVYGTVASGGNTYNSDLTITGGNFACGMPPWAEEASVVESVAASTTPPGIPGQEWPEEPEPPEIETLPTVDLLSVYIHPDYSELTLDWDWGGMTATEMALIDFIEFRVVEDDAPNAMFYSIGGFNPLQEYEANGGTAQPINIEEMLYSVEEELEPYVTYTVQTESIPVDDELYYSSSYENEDLHFYLTPHDEFVWDYHVGEFSGQIPEDPDDPGGGDSEPLEADDISFTIEDDTVIATLSGIDIPEELEWNLASTPDSYLEWGWGIQFSDGVDAYEISTVHFKYEGDTPETIIVDVGMFDFQTDFWEAVPGGASLIDGVDITVSNLGDEITWTFDLPSGVDMTNADITYLGYTLTDGAANEQSGTYQFDGTDWGYIGPGKVGQYVFE